MAKRGDWVPCRDYAVPQGVSTGPAGQYNCILVRNGDSFLATPQVSVMESPDDVVVERVVGQWGLESENDALVGMRIRLAIYDDTNDQVAFYADSLFSGGGANEPFLWQRYSRPAGSLSNLDFVVHPWWCSMDVRVARRLPRDRALVLTVECLSGDAIFTPYLRSWARQG